MKTRVALAFAVSASLTVACSSESSSPPSAVGNDVVSTSGAGHAGASGNAQGGSLADGGTASAGTGGSTAAGTGGVGNGGDDSGLGGSAGIGAAGASAAGSAGAAGSPIDCSTPGTLSLDDFCGPALYGPGPLCQPTYDAWLAGPMGQSTDVLQGCGFLGVQLATPYGGRTIFYDQTSHLLVGARGVTDCSCGPCGFGSWSAGVTPPADCDLCAVCGTTPYNSVCGSGGAGAGGGSNAVDCGFLAVGGGAGAGGSGGAGGN